MLKYYSGSEEDLVEYIDHMGDDDAVCDAARVSMDKTAEMFSVAQNEKLLRYLAKHNHWSPFSHCSVKMRFKAPIFIARQLAKHQIGFSWNEVSRRYVNSEPSYWFPNDMRMKAENVKQGSLEEPHKYSTSYRLDMDQIFWKSHKLYTDMIESGVCAEQARMVLPQSMMTEWIWTGSLYAWNRMYLLRSDSHAQFEVRIYAKLVDQICSKHFPLSWRALNEFGSTVD